MLGVGRYLLGVIEIGFIVGFAWLGAGAVRKRIVSELGGAAGQLATAILAVALLLWMAELLGTVGVFERVPYLVTVTIVGLGFWLGMRGGWGGPSGAAASRFSPHRRLRTVANSSGEKPSKTEGHPHPPRLAALVALAIAGVAVIHFAAGVKVRLSTGMTGFDSTWYHGPFAAGFFQSGDTWSLHYIAPQFLAWFYPANSEVLHAVGMLAFSRDILSPLLNLGWFVGCLVAAWCIGRPYRVGPFSLALGAIALSVPALSDQAGEARNDVVGIFFLLAAVAIAVNAWAVRGDEERLPLGAVAVVGLAAGLAAGTKLNFLLPSAAMVVGLALIAVPGRRWKTLAVAALATLAGGGYWYLRNLAHTGNPLPWVKHLGPVTLPAPEQALGGREGHSVLSYITDGSIWSEWFLPGLHHGLGVLWPLLGALSVAGLVLCLTPPTHSLGCFLSRSRGEKEQRKGGGVPAVAGLVGLATALAWLIAPTSASGPAGMPHGFESGLRYLAPALTLGLALLPTAPVLRSHLTTRWLTSPFSAYMADKDKLTIRIGVLVFLLLVAIAVGYPIQRHYLERRYADPSFTVPGLNAAFRWSRDISDARIATTSTRQYPLFGTDLSNHVTYVGEERPHGGFTAPTTCLAWRRLLNAGDYDYVIATRDRIEPGKPPYPVTARWTAGPGATVILRNPPTVVYKLRGKLDPSACRDHASRRGALFLRFSGGWRGGGRPP